MQIIEDDSIDLKTRYNQYRIMELEKLILTETSLDTINEYKNTILKIILSETAISEQEKIYTYIW
jgi:hypothetical protein